MDSYYSPATREIWWLFYLDHKGSAMLTILIAIAVAGRLKSLRMVLIIAFILPFPILYFGAPPAALLLRVPATVLAAFLSFKYYQRKREKKRLELSDG
jgi:hypothetical protein